MASKSSHFDNRDLEPWPMARALELAEKGRGHVEPNPLVGCVIVAEGEIVGEGYHRRFGGPHAEVEALESAGRRAHGATMYVTLEPCCHDGKTPPCTRAIIGAGVKRVVSAMPDPFPEVASQGFAELQAAGIEVDVGRLEDEARYLNAPYLTLLEKQRPWIIAKWAMTLDGRIATRTGDSRWISNEASRTESHHLRGRVDGIMVGRGTAEIDDPLLTARPPGPRLATRIVVDSQASLSSESQLVQTAREAPVIVAAGEQSTQANRSRLSEAGCEVFVCQGTTSTQHLRSLLAELARRRFTNLLVEGGSRLLGGLFDAGLIDEVHVFIAPILAGGHDAPGPFGGHGVDRIVDALHLVNPTIEQREGDVHIHGRLAKA